MTHVVTTGSRPTSTPATVRLRVAPIPRWIVLGLVIRLILMPFHHPWDLQTWYNMFVDLSQNHSPYATFHELTATYRSQRGLRNPRDSATTTKAVQDTFYEYYAYPPLLMILYYPLAQAAARVIPLRRQFTIHGPAAVIVIPPLFHVFFKLPLFLAELGIVALLWRAAGQVATRRFFLNPLVILVSAMWTVDALMTLAVLWSLDLLRRERYQASALALAAGALIKMLPAVFFPAILLHLWHRRTPLRTLGAYVGTFVLANLVVIAPFWAGFREVLSFQALRPGANLSVHILLYPVTTLTNLDRHSLDYLWNFASPVVGTITLVTALSLAYAHIARHRYALSQTLIIVMLAFLLGSKVVNEPYVYLLIPLLLFEMHRRPNAAKEISFKALYAVPVAFAILNVPLLYTAAPLYRYFWRGVFPMSYEWVRAFPTGEHAVYLTALALSFVAACTYTLTVMIREGRTSANPGAQY